MNRLWYVDTGIHMHRLKYSEQYSRRADSQPKATEMVSRLRGIQHIPKTLRVSKLFQLHTYPNTATYVAKTTYPSIPPRTTSAIF